MTNVNEKVKAALEKADDQKRQLSPADAMCLKLASPAVIKSLTAALPSAVVKDAERFSRNLMTLMRLTPQLAKCTPDTIMGGALTGAAMGLDPTPGMNEFYLVPFDNRKAGRTEAQFILGYKDMQKLLYQGGCKKVIAREVRANDKFRVSYGYEDALIHEPPVKGERGEVIGYYAAVILPSGEKSMLYMTKEEVTAHAKARSRAFNYGPWQTDFDAMAEKTCLRQLFRWLPKDVKGQKAEIKDGGIIAVKDYETPRPAEDVLDIQAEPVEIEEEKPADVSEQPAAEVKPSAPSLEEQMDLILGDEGLDLTKDERERFIADTLGIAYPITQNYKTDKNFKAVISAAMALLKARDK